MNDTFLCMIFRIEYSYLDDLCSFKSSNNWNRSTMKKRKDFVDPQKKSIEENYENVVFLSFFEQKISLANNSKSETNNIFL